jgi:hypothetical protein
MDKSTDKIVEAASAAAGVVADVAVSAVLSKTGVGILVAGAAGEVAERCATALTERALRAGASVVENVKGRIAPEKPIILNPTSKDDVFHRMPQPPSAQATAGAVPALCC